MKAVKPKYEKLLADIGFAIETTRQNPVRRVNIELVKANGEIGRHIVQFEQSGNEREANGSDLLSRLSKDLQLKFFNRFGRQNILNMQGLFCCSLTLSNHLST